MQQEAKSYGMVCGIIPTGLLYNLNRKLHMLEGTNKEYMIPG